MLWQCGCGCRGIAGDLQACPMCFKERVPDTPAAPEPAPVPAAQPPRKSAKS